MACGERATHFRSLDDRDRCAGCPCGQPMGRVLSTPAVWHPTASDAFGATWGQDMRHAGSEPLGEYVRRERARGEAG